MIFLRLATLFIVTLSVMPSIEATAQAYPSRPIRIIVPFAAGGGSDMIGRLIGPKLSEGTGQPAVIDNRSGAGGIIGTELAAKALPDGYTLFIANPAHAINATLQPKLSFDSLRDFTSITVIATQPYAVVVSATLPAQNIKDLIALARAKPKELTYASSGLGSSSHLATEMFINTAGIAMTHIPYKGTGPALSDVVSGRVPVIISSILPLVSHVKAGRLRMIAVTSAQRSPSLPDVPTVAEAGFPGYAAIAWYMLLTPAKTPESLVALLNKRTVEALKSEEVRRALTQAGTDPLGNSPREAAAFLKGEVERWGKVIRQAGVKAE